MSLELDYNVLSAVYSQNFVKILQHLEIKYIFDVEGWIEQHKDEKSKYTRYPCVGSIFNYGKGGSYDFFDETLGDVIIRNGTLSQIDGKQIPFGEEYYKAKYNRGLPRNNY